MNYQNNYQFLEKKILWDTRDDFIDYPKIIKHIYRDIYNKNVKKFCDYIDQISLINIDNLRWWFSTPASRYELISSFYKNICIILTIQQIVKNSFFVEVVINSPALKKILSQKFKSNIQINLIKDISFTKRLYFFLEKPSF